MSEKIKPHHLERKAILYVRQSSAYQVHNNLALDLRARKSLANRPHGPRLTRGVPSR